MLEAVLDKGSEVFQNEVDKTVVFGVQAKDSFVVALVCTIRP